MTGWQKWIGILGAIAVSHAKADVGEKYKVGGYLIADLKAETLKNGETGQQVKFDIESKRKNGYKAELGIRVKSEDNTARIREALLNKKLDNDWRFEIGFGKKRFGLEYDKGRLKRSTITRSPIYRRMEVFTYVGRETHLRWFKKYGEGPRKEKFSVSLGHSEAQNTSFIASWYQTLNESWQGAYWLQILSDHVDDGQQLVWAGMYSLSYQAGSHNFENEYLFGVDPDQSELEKTLGIGQHTRFAAVKFHYDYDFLMEDQEIWEVMVQSTLLYHDMKELGFNSVQLLAGVNYRLEPVRFAFNLEGIGTTSRLDTSNRSFSESSAKLEMIYEL